MTKQCPRFQIAFLGAGSVGKTSILQRYLSGNYSEEYSETVEETYSQPYYINGKRKNIDFIDTSGSIPFPAMQQIYMSQATGFVLVYSINNKQSFDEMKSIWEKIKQVRKSVLNIPVVVVGNNLDMENVRQIETFDALNWAYDESLGGCFLEVSAKTDQHIKDVYEILLEQLGNKRSEQRGPFRIRLTSLNRRQCDSNDTRRNSKRRKSILKKSQSFTTETLIPSDKCFQDSVFDDYKQQTITRIHKHVRTRRCSSLEDRNNSLFCQTFQTSPEDKTVDRKRVSFHGNKNIHSEIGIRNHYNFANNNSQTKTMSCETDASNVKTRFSSIVSACRLVRKYCNKLCLKVSSTKGNP
ncbi:DIRAS2 [Mytilus edulis]|uniref:DIRAS2 n=1 Tax=Mytilus edulis TaxID=6550 RepID=A0A8S3S5T9_MYTED|nr:DIRAS2 [Mytilus edulis]